MDLPLILYKNSETRNPAPEIWRAVRDLVLLTADVDFFSLGSCDGFKTVKIYLARGYPSRVVNEMCRIRSLNGMSAVISKERNGFATSVNR